MPFQIFLTNIAALFTPLVMFISASLFFSSLLLLWYGVDPVSVFLRALVGFLGIGGAVAVSSIPSVQKLMLSVQEDDRTIAAHWAQDADLVKLTWGLRAGYLISVLTMLAGMYMLVTLDLPALYQFSSSLIHDGVENDTRIDQIYAWLQARTSVHLVVFSLLIFFVTSTLQFVAACHIIFFRNNPVRNGMIAFCKECYKYGAPVLAGGVLTGGTVTTVMASSSLHFKATVATNFVNMYGPFSQGYGFALGTSTPHIRDMYLRELPNYNPHDLLGPGNILDSEKQNAFVGQNIGTIRKKFSTLQLQAMEIDPPIISNYGTGVMKK